MKAPSLTTVLNGRNKTLYVPVSYYQVVINVILTIFVLFCCRL